MSFFDEVGARLRGWFLRDTEEKELEEEIRFHLEMEERKLVGEGMSPSRARTEARRRFGGEDRMKERARDERGTRLLEDLAQDVHYGVRSLARSPGFTVTAVLTLALGIGAGTAVFSVVDGVLLRPLPYGDPDRLVEIRELGEGRRFFPSFPNFQDWRERSVSFDAMVALQPLGAMPVLGAGDPFRAPLVLTSRDLLATAGLQPFLGRDIAPEEHVPGGPDVVLVSHRLWETRFGAEPELDRIRFELLGNEYRVVGVLPPGFEVFYEADLYLSAERWPGTVRSAHAYRVAGRLKADVPVSTARQEMEALTRRMKEEYGGDTNAETAQVTPLDEVLLGNQTRPLALLLAASGILLLVACANVAGTLLARGTVRGRELTVRASLGAGRGRMVRMLVTESLLLAGGAGMVGAALAWAGVTAAVRMAPEVLPRMESVTVDGRVLAFASAAAVATALLFGLWPSLRLSRHASTSGLNARGSTVRAGRGWGMLIAWEVGLAVVLLVGAGVLLRSLNAIVTLDAGWDPDGVLQMTFAPPAGVFDSPDAALGFIRQLESDLAGMPGVTAVGLANLGPLDAGSQTAPARDADTGAALGGYAGWRLVDAGYFEALRIPLVRGRLFGPGETGVAVVDESFARRLWGEEDPLGRRVLSNYDPDQTGVEVVGVVRTARDWRMDAAEQMEMFVPWWAYAGSLHAIRYVIRTTGDPLDLVDPVRARVRSLEPRIPVEFTTLASEFSNSTADRRFVAAVLGAFAASGLLLALMGIFGIVSYTVARQRREIGIRMALGARAGTVRSEARAAALRPAAAGLLLGSAGAVLSAGLMESLLYEGMPSRDPVVIAAVGVAFLVAAAVAADVPARRASGVDPVIALREE
ncbi:MAG: hypothetical protein AMXMBFR53_44530 [Gemmatimonadota bacterium]